MEILKVYEQASGQEINLTKSKVFFSCNFSRAAQEDLSNMMGVKHVMGTGAYLGLPSMMRRSKKETFAFIKDEIWKRINLWRSRPLSRAGKEIMIKSVLQAIPTYVMSIYLLPDSLIDNIERMINAFCWGGGDNNKGIRWLAWKRTVCPKEEGGLGFRDFQLFNMAMVAKQDSKLGNNPSFTWRSIWKSRKVLLHGCRWSIGDGSNIKVMGEPWLRVEDGGWVASPQNQESEANMILAVPLLHLVERDRVVWNEEGDEIYSVRSGYQKLLKERNSSSRPRKGEARGVLWIVQAPPKAKHLLWRICKECLPTRTRFRNRYVQCPIECPFCLVVPEEEWLEDKQVARKMATLLWCIWQNRNSNVWNNKKLRTQQVGIQEMHLWNEWEMAQDMLDEYHGQDQQMLTPCVVVQWQ
ncbi:hypothetical protein TSUD_392480 [Trifolium subterraneum]|uniref:Reverse transcriptase zinc-binding domain-containing protein n=1 Tax=Trifolium subterraneum TaxID=3900 RepID=A0A2Z6N351_TRISU|nr:hypothetical protein TSUD_392480 [Trifolium subterraneum]